VHSCDFDRKINKSNGKTASMILMTPLIMFATIMFLLIVITRSIMILFVPGELVVTMLLKLKPNLTKDTINVFLYITLFLIYIRFSTFLTKFVIDKAYMVGEKDQRLSTLTKKIKTINTLYEIVLFQINKNGYIELNNNDFFEKKVMELLEFYYNLHPDEMYKEVCIVLEKDVAFIKDIINQKKITYQKNGEYYLLDNGKETTIENSINHRIYYWNETILWLYSI
jgi:hypothetical protein